MIKKISIIFILSLSLLLSFVFAPDMECRYTTDTSCNANEAQVFLANDLVNAKIMINETNNIYDHRLCCRDKSGRGNLSFGNSSYLDACSDETLFTMTDWMNAKIYDPDFENVSHNDVKTANSYSSLCGNYTDGSLLVDWQYPWNPIPYDYEYNGYTCMFKVSNFINGKVKSCTHDYLDSTGSVVDYPFTVWGKLIGDDEFLNCNLDCTSKVDGRVYTECGVKIDACKKVPSVCNGAIKGTWVNISSTSEVRCDDPWDTYRGTGATSEDVVVSSNEGICQDLIEKSYKVLVNNEIVDMNIYICNEGI